MKFRSTLAMAALAVAALVPVALSGGAAAATPTQVRVVDAFGAGSGASVDHTFCVDGANPPLASLSTTQMSDPTALAPGDYTIGVHDGLNADCTAKPIFTQDITIPAVASATLVLYWPVDSNGRLAVFPDDTSCVQPGTGRVTLRNTATYFQGISDVDLRATPPGGTDTLLIDNVANPGQGSADLLTGTYTGAAVTDHATTNSLTSVAPFDVSSTTQKFIYTYGISAAESGAFITELPSSACSAPTTTSSPTTVAPTTTVAPSPAPAANPVTVQPTYTG